MANWLSEIMWVQCKSVSSVEFNCGHEETHKGGLADG